MRELSFKGYLQQQLCELSNYNSRYYNLNLDEVEKISSAKTEEK